MEERETVVNVSSKLRTDLKRQNLERSREKYFSPPKKPWDFSSFSQPKRLWDISPPYRREVERGDDVSTVSREGSKESSNDSCNETRTICGLSPANRGIGRQRWHGNALYQETPTEAKTTVVKKPSHSNPEDQINVSIHASSPKICPSWLHESNSEPKSSSHDESKSLSSPEMCSCWFDGSNPSPKASNQDNCRPCTTAKMCLSRLGGSKNASPRTSSQDVSRQFTTSKMCPSGLDGMKNPSPKTATQGESELITTALSEGHGFALCEEPPARPKAKDKPEIPEVQKLKVQMALLCEKLASYIIQGEIGKDGSAEDVSGMKELRLLKVVGELGKVLVGQVTVGAEGGIVDQEASCLRDYSGNKEKERLNCGYRSEAWKVGLCTIFQLLFWYLIMIRPVIRCTKHLRYLPPT